MTNDGRADIVSVDPNTGGLTLWENACPAVPSTPSTPDPTIPTDPDDTEVLECNPKNPEPGCMIVDTIPACRDGNKYHTIDDVERGLVNKYCVNKYLLNALAETLAAAMTKYDAIIKDKYKAKYNAFVKMVRGQSYRSWEEIWTLSDTYWNCFDTVSGKKTSIACHKNGHTAEIWEEKAGFCDSLTKDYQLDCKLFTYPKSTVSEAENPGSVTCRLGDCTYISRTVYKPVYDREFAVPDPADSITKSLTKYREFSSWLTDVSGSAQIDQYEESEGDVVDASVITVLSVQAAADAMQTVAEDGEEAIEEQRKRTIVAFVTAFLLIVPGVGEAAGAALAAAWVGRLAALVDVAGNTALGIYSIVEDKSNAPGEVVGILFGFLGARNNFGWGNAAKKSRAIDDVVFKKLGDFVASGVLKSRKLLNKCGT